MRGTLTALLISAISLGGQSAPPTFATLSRQADAARDAKQLEQALALYQRALKLKPDWDEGLWNLGSIAYDLDRYSECAPAFRKLAGLKPDSVPAWTMSGLCEYKLRRYDAALESLSHAESLKFKEPAELARAALAASGAGAHQDRQLRTCHHRAHRPHSQGQEDARDRGGGRHRRAASTLAAFRGAGSQPRTGLQAGRCHGLGDGDGFQGSDREVRSRGRAVSAKRRTCTSGTARS